MKTKKRKHKISSDLLHAIESLISSTGTVDTKVTSPKLKPIEVGDVAVDSTTTEKKALYTTISGNQSTKLKKNDSVANILAKIYIAMKEDRLEMIKQKELDRNFREEHIKERRKKYSNVANSKIKKFKSKSDKGGPWSLLIMGLISESGRIIEYLKDLIGPWDQFSKKIEDQFTKIKTYVTTELANDITSFLKDLEKTILAKVGQVYDGLMDQVEGYLINWSSGFKGIHLPRWNKFMDDFSVFDEKKQPRTTESDAETAQLVAERENNIDNASKNNNTIPTAENSKELNEKGVTGRSTGDRLENTFNSTVSKVGIVAGGVGKVVGNTAVSVALATAKDVNSMANQTQKEIKAATVKTPEETAQYHKEQIELHKTHTFKPGFAAGTGSWVKKTPEEIKKSEIHSSIVDQINEIPTENPTTSKFLKEQSKLNDAQAKTASSSGVTTLPAQVIPSSGSNKMPSTSVSSSAPCRNHDDTLGHIQKQNLCRP